MKVSAGVLGAGALLLLVAGAVKVVDPSRTAGALRTLGWSWATPPVVRAGAGLETALGAAALVLGSAVLATLVALSYLGLAGFVAVALRSGRPIGSCGCLGQADTPPSAAHVAVNVVLAVGAATAAVTGSPPLLSAPWPSVALAVVLTTAAAGILTRR